MGFNLEAVHTSECFSGRSAIVVPPWSESGNNLPHNQDLSSYSHFKGVSTFVLPHNSSVDILIGLDNSQLMTVLEERVGEIDQPHAIMTPLGWIASGGNVRSDTHEVTARKVSVSPIFDDKDLKILELQETIRILAADNETTQLSLSDLKAQRMVEDNIEVCENRYRIPVPLKEHAINLPNNFELAAKRLDFLRKRMTKNPDIADKVIQSMKELKQSGYIVPAGAERKRLLNYLPYFLTEQTKPRVVYDGSATWSKQCVNDVIYSGPDELNVLSHVLARFRMGKYALMADLSKCFLQILLPEEQQDLFRILWYKEDDITKGEIEEFKFTRHVWGVISSPYIACRAIRKVTEENPTQASTLTVKAIQRSMYMDDFLVSSDTLEDEEVIASESINLFKSGGFQLVKWSANKAAKSVIAELDEGNLAPVIRTIDLTKDDPLPNFKAVGCIWDAEHDSLRMQLHLDQPDVYTRRTMLSQISRQYDPLGYLAPLVLKGRLILQQMAIDEFSWDEVVDPRYKKAWDDWLNLLASWKEFSVPRWNFADEPNLGTYEDASYELHGFSDASNDAYGCAIYLRRICKGTTSTSLVFGKSRIVLRNQQTWAIARKELIAALLSVELMNSACDALQLTNCKKHFWSDSKVVLRWIKNPDLRLPKFVARRIDTILRASRSEQWHYCASGDNPADVATRPLSTNSCSDRMKLWLAGPNIEKLMITQDSLPGTVQVHELRAQTPPAQAVSSLTYIIDTAPSWYILKKRTAYLMAFTEFIKCKTQHKTFVKPRIDSAYLDKAMHRLILYVQRKCFGTVIKKLKDTSPDCFEDIVKKAANTTQTENIKETTAMLQSLRSLRPCIHADGTFRVEGRISRADLPTDEKHPIILPSRHPLTRLLILNCHQECAHGGTQYTLMLTRRQYWIIKGLSSVRHYLGRCNACIIKKAKPVRQLMGDLPNSRIAAHNKPFFHTGCDYFGPITYREGRSDKKAWGLLFSCMASRAVHVELVTSLDLSSFILAFSRFVDVRGPVSGFHSDNGSTFKAAAHILPDLLSSDDLQSFFRQKGISWEFIPPYSPAQRGAWESLVKVFKKTLLQVASSSHRTPNLMELQTYVSNTTYLVNNRPLTSTSDDPRDHTAITPASLLTPYFHPHTPIGTPHDKDHLRRDYRFNVGIAQRFWQRWIKYYLPQLQKRKKWFKCVDNLKVGQLVLVGSHGEFNKRGQYRMGRVTEVLPQIRKGKAIVRRAVVAVNSTSSSSQASESELTLIERDISKLAPLELAD